MSAELFARVVDDIAESVVTGPTNARLRSTRSAVETAVAAHLRSDTALTFVQVMKHTRYAGVFEDAAGDVTNWPDKRRQDAIVFFALCGDVEDRVAWYLSPRPIM
jgi:hypothetical protein